MESSAAAHTEFGTVAAGADTGRRWWIVALAALIPFGIALALGMATKSSTTPTLPTGALAPAVSQASASASVTGLKPAAAVPALRAVPKPAARPAAHASSPASSAAAPATSSASTASSSSSSTYSAPSTSSSTGYTPPAQTPTRSSSSGSTGSVISVHGGG